MDADEKYRPPHLVTAAELIRGGCTREAIAKKVGGGELRRLRDGVYAVADGEGDRGDLPAHEVARRRFVERSLAAARVLLPGTALSHGSALALHDLPLYDVPVDLPTATRSRSGGGGGGRRSTGLACASGPLDGVVTHVYGVPVTAVPRTIVDVTRTVGLESGVCAADEAIRRGMCTRSDLQREAEAARGRTGAARARALPELTSGLAESVLESLVRLIVEFSDLPTPELQVGLTGRDGSRKRVDFYWRGHRVVVEVDGFEKYGRTPEEIRRHLRDERRRQRQLEAAGYIVIRFVWEDIYRPEWILTRIRTELRRQERLGVRPAA
ncbi:MAG TPA: DUF559 domain-containing protein [Actinomycetales bacterium]|nr:DUF559 domain-containing protein [Actinomycetales bacterium]